MNLHRWNFTSVGNQYRPQKPQTLNSAGERLSSRINASVREIRRFVVIHTLTGRAKHRIDIANVIGILTIILNHKYWIFDGHFQNINCIWFYFFPARSQALALRQLSTDQCINMPVRTKLFEWKYSHRYSKHHYEKHLKLYYRHFSKALEFEMKIK